MKGNFDKRSKQLLDYCIDPDINFPDHLFSYCVGCAPFIYSELVVKCTNILGLNQVPAKPEKLMKSIKERLELTFYFVGKGSLNLNESYGSSENFVDFLPAATKLRASEDALINAEGLDSHPDFYVFFILLALLDLKAYRDAALESFAPQEHLDTSSLAVPFLKKSIESLGLLLTAQTACELGFSSLERQIYLANNKELKSKLDQVNTALLENKEKWSRGGKNRSKSYELAYEIMREEVEQNPIENFKTKKDWAESVYKKIKKSYKSENLTCPVKDKDFVINALNKGSFLE